MFDVRIALPNCSREAANTLIRPARMGGVAWVNVMDADAAGSTLRLVSYDDTETAARAEGERFCRDLAMLDQGAQVLTVTPMTEDDLD